MSKFTPRWASLIVIRNHNSLVLTLLLGLLWKFTQQEPQNLNFEYFRYKACHHSNLNSYNWGPGKTDFAVGICWVTYSTYYNSMKQVEMAIRGKLSSFGQRLSTCLVTERSWVQIPGFFSSISFSVSISGVSLIRSLTEVHHYWFSWKNVCLAVQLEAKQAKNARIEQKNKSRGD